MHMGINVFRWWWVGILTVLIACNSQRPSSQLFELLDAEVTGIRFSNDITEQDSLNVIDYAYIYNGGGVGIGDFNNDGWDDLFFAGNMVSNHLYLNQGEFRFRDVSRQAGIQSGRWCTGVALVDINQDGWLDIYVSVASKFSREDSRNLLYINNGTSQGGVPTFTEAAAAYGLDDDGYSTQAAFLDYDRDGDLDMYLLTNGMESFNHNNSRPKKTAGEGVSTDRLYRNEGTGPNGHPVFQDVSREANILKEGYGLGVAVTDINQDGWPDIYAANDFITNDLLWINNGAAADSVLTFTDKAPAYLRHQTHNGMGVDIADYNNDGLSDIVVLDMLPEGNLRQKTMLGKPNYDRFMLNLELGYTPQYLRNTLQLNNGLTPAGDISFSEIGQLAGIYKTDWSWTALFGDYDNDGLRDLLITNGYAKDVTDLDYIVYQSSASQFGTPESRESRKRELGKLLKEARVHNYVFRNNGDLTFSDKSEAWGMEQPSFSNGAAFADLDRDGDLDLVMNNINAPAFVYENRSERLGHHYLRIVLEGPQGNRQGLGTTLRLWHEGQMLYHYHSLYRGYKSTVESGIHFGLGRNNHFDSLEVVWPDGRQQMLRMTKANQVITLRHSKAQQPKRQRQQPKTPLLRQDSLLAYYHQHRDVVDFKYQPLLYRKHSQDGPGVAVADINGDGLDDMYIGGAAGYSGTLLLQTPEGRFQSRPLGMDEESEDMGALFFDADGDGDQDLYVVSGGSAYHAEHAAYQDRLYRNDGQGRFSRDRQALPAMISSGSCVVAADYDQDGDLDLFTGGRLLPQQYPLPPRSYLLRNDGATFTDVTSQQAPQLAEAGMVTAALWTDFNQDGQADLMVAGEWMPIRFFANRQGKFEETTATAGLLNSSGWWNSLLSGDFDQDGDMDYVAGNMGLNTRYQPADKEPVRLYAKDYDKNGSIDPVMSFYLQGKEYPVHARDALSEQLVGMRRRFPRYEMYGQATFSDVFTEQELEGAYMLQAKRMASSYLENLGNGRFHIRELPMKAQFAPVFGMAAHDFNQDGRLDLLLAGNSYAMNVQDGWADASVGLLLAGNGKGGFRPVSLEESGFYVSTDAKALAGFYTADQYPHWLLTSHGDSARVWSFPKAAARADTVMQVSAEDPTLLQKVALEAGDFYVLLEMQDGSSYRQEFHYGQGFLSQSSRHFVFDPARVRKLSVYDFQGNVRELYDAGVLSQGN